MIDEYFKKGYNRTLKLTGLREPGTTEPLPYLTEGLRFKTRFNLKSKELLLEFN